MSKDSINKINLTYKAGDFISIPVNFTDYDNNALELVDRTIYVMIKNDKDDSDSKAILNKQLFISSSTNTFYLELQTIETINLEGEYLLDIIVSYPSDSQNRHITISGTLNFIKALRQTI